jgi:hypothetical protein
VNVFLVHLLLMLVLKLLLQKAQQRCLGHARVAGAQGRQVLTTATTQRQRH